MSEKFELPEKLPPDLQVLVDYWRTMRESLGHVPWLTEINLIDLYKIASRLFIADRVETEDGIIRYRWRYWGSTLCRFAGAEVTGKFLDETHDEEATAAATEFYDWALENGEPHHSRQGIRVIGTQKAYWTYERVIVPLMDKTGQPGHVAGVYFSEQDGKVFKPDSLENKRISYSFGDS